MSKSEETQDGPELDLGGARHRVVIVGATSAIAQTWARTLDLHKTKFLLIARSEEKVKTVASDLIARGALSADIMVVDVRSRDAHAEMVNVASNVLISPTIVMIAHGTLPDQELLNTDVDATLDSFLTNAVSVISIAQRFALHMVAHGGGSIVVLSSVAGERARKTIYAYGAAKSAISMFGAGLGAHWADKGLHVLVVKPGPVATPMIAHRPKSFITTSTSHVAKRINAALKSKSSVIYVPWFWRYIMGMLRYVPEKMFRKIKI
ncbi:MAG: SDR family NAD(P)-dependent oxidoreductase [bacterium]|nr:SDR family NAD(P)-dependent oxidoreductase [bacterium]